MPQPIDKLAWLYLQDKQLLATRTKGQDAYYLPGGKREAGESDADALIRELKEELTIDVQPESIAYFGTFQAQAHGKPAGTMVKMTCYQADFTGTISAASEIAETVWISSKDKARCSLVLQLILEELQANHLIA
ncbi:MAG: NUDIX domain-containing protein [Caldilineaceae bacterium]